MDRKLLTSGGVADTYRFLIDTCNTLPECYQQNVYNNTLATAKRQIQQAENPTPAVVICVEAVRVDNAILVDHLISEVALEEPEIRSTDPNIPKDNNWMDDELHFGILWGSWYHEDERDKSDLSDAIPTASRRRQATTEFERFALATSDVHGYKGKDGNDADADEEEEKLQADDRSTQNVEDWGHCRFDLGTSNIDGYEGEDGDNADEEEEASQADDGLTQNVEASWRCPGECEDRTVCLRPVTYDNGKANAMASDVFEAKTEL